MSIFDIALRGKIVMTMPTLNTLTSFASTKEEERRKMLLVVIDSFVKNNPSVSEEEIKDLMGAVMDYSHAQGERHAFEVIKRDYTYK